MTYAYTISKFGRCVFVDMRSQLDVVFLSISASTLSFLIPVVDLYNDLRRCLILIVDLTLKLKCGQYPVIHTRLYPKAPLYNIIIIVDTVVSQNQNFKHEK